MAAPARLADADIATRLKTLPGWSLEGGKLHKAFTFADFVEAWETLRSRAGDGAARLHGARVDGTDEGAFAAFVADVLARHQRLDVLVNTVGGFAGGDLASTSLAEWRRMLDLNLTSAVIGCRAV